MSTRRIVATLIVSGVAVLVPSPAAALTATASCSSEQHNLNASQNYTRPDGPYNRWWTYDFEITGAGTGGESNVIIRLRANGVDKWARDYTSVNQDQTYSDGMGGVKTLKSEESVVLFRGIFDVFGSDPACNAYTKSV